MEVFEKIIERLKSEVNYNDGAETGLNQSIEIVNQTAENYENTLHETMIELLSGAWVDSDKVQSVLGLSFAECLSLLDFSRTAEWWSVAGKTEEERAREGQKIEKRFRLKNNNWIPCSDIDRLPDDGTPVLVQDFEGYYEVCYCETKHGAKGFTSGDWWHSVNNYIAWHKLPEPYHPKGENNENS